MQQGDAACRDARDVIRCVVSGQESEREGGGKRDGQRFRGIFLPRSGTRESGEKNPSELEVTTMNRELVEKFIEVTGEYRIVRALARELSFRLNSATTISQRREYKYTRFPLSESRRCRKCECRERYSVANGCRRCAGRSNLCLSFRRERGDGSAVPGVGRWKRGDGDQLDVRGWQTTGA